MSKIAIQIKNVSHTYKSFERGETLKDMFQDLFFRKHIEVNSLANVSLDISKGEILGLLGANGAGKTTLLKILSGLLPCGTGSVSVLGQNPYKRETTYLQNIGFVFGQKSQLNWNLTPFDTFDLLRAIYSIPQAEFEQRVEKFSYLLNFQNKIRTPVRKLSLGERMKAELICSLIHLPKILFLDEPTIGLDIVSQKAIRTFIREMVDEIGVTVILTSHYMNDIETLSDRIAVLDKGMITFLGNKDDLVRKFSDTVQIKVTTSNSSSFEFLVSVGFVRNGEGEWIGDFHHNSVNETLKSIINNVEVNRLSVATKSLEETIHDIFSQKSNVETV